MTDPGLAGLVDLACHDLRTPLATVNGFTKTILRAGRDLELAPSAPAATTSDVGAIVARAAVEALGGSVELDGETLRVRI
jgi:K+-sensing histidine kinase KdpD